MIDTAAGQRIATWEAEKAAGKDGNCESCLCCRRQLHSVKWKNGRSGEKKKEAFSGGEMDEWVAV